MQRRHICGILWLLFKKNLVGSQSNNLSDRPTPTLSRCRLLHTHHKSTLSYREQSTGILTFARRTTKSLYQCAREKKTASTSEKKKDRRQISVAKITHHPSRSFPSLSACVRLHSQGSGIHGNINLKNAQKGVQKNFFVLTSSLLPQWLPHILALTKPSVCEVCCRWQRRERNRGLPFPRHPPLPGLQVQTFSVS